MITVGLGRVRVSFEQCEAKPGSEQALVRSRATELFEKCLTGSGRGSGSGGSSSSLSSLESAIAEEGQDRVSEG